MPFSEVAGKGPVVLQPNKPQLTAHKSWLKIKMLPLQIFLNIMYFCLLYSAKPVRVAENVFWEFINI